MALLDGDGGPLALLFDDTPDGGVLPVPLRQAYGGDLDLRAPRVYANFVASLDGVVTLAGAGESGARISGGSGGDRFVMGLLRACADVVLVGAGTLRHAAGDLWRAEAAFPPAAASFAALRRQLGLRATPPLAVVSASGELDAAAPALADAVVLTTRAGAARLGSVAAGTRVHALEDLSPAALLARLRAEGFARILCEGGPTLFSELARAGVVDELFLTSAPRLLGRYAGDARRSLIDGLDAAATPPLTLLAARRQGSHLFLRYRLRRETPPPARPSSA